MLRIWYVTLKSTCWNHLSIWLHGSTWGSESHPPHWDDGAQFPEQCQDGLRLFWSEKAAPCLSKRIHNYFGAINVLTSFDQNWVTSKYVPRIVGVQVRRSGPPWFHLSCVAIARTSKNLQCHQQVMTENWPKAFIRWSLVRIRIIKTCKNLPLLPHTSFGTPSKTT